MRGLLAWVWHTCDLSDDLCCVYRDHIAPERRALSARSRVVPGPPESSLPGYRTDAIRAGFATARGRYITVLDGPSVVFGHFVETFVRLGTEHPAAVLRAQAIAQPMRQLTCPGGRTGFEPAAGATPATTAHFSLLEHLVSPESPPGSYALERSYVDSFAPGCDEDEMLAEAAMLGGVHETPGEVTLLLRRFEEQLPIIAAEVDSMDQHLRANQVDRTPMTFHALSRTRPTRPVAPGPSSPSTTSPLEDARAELADVRAQLADVRAQLADVLGELAAVRDPTSWHLIAPLRRLSNALHRAGWWRSE